MIMDLITGIELLVNDYTLQVVALGAAILGIVSGALGCFAVLRKQSLIGDAISHAALPGIVLAFMIFRSKAPLLLMLGAILAGWAGTAVVMGVVRNTRIKQDSALGFVLSVFFGFGLVLLTFVQKMPDARQAGLDRFLFGQAATMLEGDVITMAALGGVALLLMGLFWKELKLLSFDVEFGASLGFPMRALDILLTSLLVVAIVIGLQSVGVVLMSAMLVAPAAAARQWTDRLSWMVLLSAVFGALSGVVGALVSSLIPRLSTGPTIVLSVSLIVLVSLFAAPKRGLLWGWLHQHQNRGSLRLEAVLAILYTLSLQHEDPQHPHPTSVLRIMGLEEASLDRMLQELKARNWAEKKELEGWYLTPAGLQKARQQAQGENGQRGELQ
jgi:manganese/zinc/iron transport system permease protein